VVTKWSNLFKLWHGVPGPVESAKKVKATEGNHRDTLRYDTRPRGMVQACVLSCRRLLSLFLF
jgi:hypothetical protein